MEEINELDTPFGLKNMLNFYWYVGLIFYLLILLSPLAVLIKNSSSTKNIYQQWLQFSLNTTNTETVTNKILLFISILNLGFFIIAIKLLRDVLLNFSRDLFFEEKTLTLLKRTGISLCICAGTYVVLENVLLYVNDAMETKHFGIYGLIMFAGQFFIVLEGVFQRARRLKEEHELTI